MSKFTETEYMSTKEILKFPDHYVALAVMVDDSGVSAVDGKKIVPRGAIVGGSDASAVDNLDKAVVGKYVAAKFAKLTANSNVENGALFLEALVAGTDGNSISLTLVDPSANTQTLGVSATGTAITVSLATDGTGVITSTVKSVAEALNADTDVKDLAKASYGGTGAGLVAAAALANLSGGAASSTTGAEGILMNDVDVTYGPSEGAMIIHGFIAVDKMPYADNDDAAAKAGSALPMIKFIK